MLTGREEEFARIESLLSEAIATRSPRPLAIYVSGPPGTGKTATVQAVIKKFQKQRKTFHFVSINCFGEASSSGNLLKEIFVRLDGNCCSKISAASASRALEELLAKAKKPILLLLDEVDNLLQRNDKLLYTIFGWPEKHEGRVIVVGIANSLDFTERLLPKLKLGTAPQLITFAPYTSTQLIGILEQRLSREKFDRKAIELCARKVALLTGDVRRALDIASQMLTNSGDDELDDVTITSPSSGSRLGLCTPQKTPAKDAGGTPAKQLKRLHSADPGHGETTPKKRAGACREVLKAINQTMSSPCQRTKLPSQTRTLFATLMRLVSSSSTAESTPPKSSLFRTPTKKENNTTSLSVSRDRLFDAFTIVCEKLLLPTPLPDELDEMLGQLESQSMIRMCRSGKAAKTGSVIQFAVEMSIARQQINDNALIAEIGQMELKC